MKYKWTPAQDNLAKKFTIKVGSNAIVLEKGKEFAFETPAQYKVFQHRMEDLLASGEVKLLSREYSNPSKQKKQPAPAPESESDESSDKEETSESDSSDKKEDDSIENKSVAELKKLLKEKEIEFAHNAKKADLIALLKG